MMDRKEKTYVVAYITADHSVRKSSVEAFRRSDEQQAREYAKGILKTNSVATGMFYVADDNAILISLGSI